MGSQSTLTAKQSPSQHASHTVRNATVSGPLAPFAGEQAFVPPGAGTLPRSVAAIAAGGPSEPNPSHPLRPMPLSFPLQRKLAIGETHDPLESEADRMADRVLRMTDPAAPAATSSAPPTLQRKCACQGTGSHCKECEEAERGKKLHRKATSAPAASPREAPPIVHEVLHSSGRPLDSATRAFFEPRFGYDFSNVRVHTDRRASESAASVGALAYTVNHSVAFNAGSYAPHTAEGRRLLAHELAHVVQQGSSPVVRRLPAPPQMRDESRSATLNLAGGKTVAVTRTFHGCPCSKIDGSFSGVFYNPNLNSLAIAYRHCHDATTFDAFLRTATSFSSGTAPTGDARLGIDLNVWGNNLQGRLIVEAVGANQNAGVSGPGVGGHARIAFQGGKWQVILDSQFMRQLAQLAPGANPNQLQVNLGARYGKYSVELSGTDLLSPSRGAAGSLCRALSDSIRICATLDVQQQPGGGAPNITPKIEFKIPFGEGARKERCWQCFCPTPVKIFTCVEHDPKFINADRTTEYRYYFGYDKTTPSEEAYLRDASTTNLEKLKADLAKPGYHVTSITGYASPEGRERQINDPLATARAKRMAEIVADAVGAMPGARSSSLPKPSIGRSELLGRNPPSPGAHLRDAIAASGLLSAEKVTPLLTGGEILPAQLTPEFLDLFTRTTPEEWMHLFGLSVDDPIRPHIEEAVRAFIAARGKGPRPWERVFRPLRFGDVTVHGTEKVRAHDDKGNLAEDTKDLSGADCDAYGKQAESQSLLGPIDESALQPIRRDADIDESCLEPAPDDVRAGCNYKPPENLRSPSPTAPSYAPYQLGGEG